MIVLIIQFLAKYNVGKQANIFVVVLCYYQGIMLVILKENELFKMFLK